DRDGDHGAEERHDEALLVGGVPGRQGEEAEEVLDDEPERLLARCASLAPSELAGDRERLLPGGHLGRLVEEHVDRTREDVRRSGRRRRGHALSWRRSRRSDGRGRRRRRRGGGTRPALPGEQERARNETERR